MAAPTGKTSRWPRRLLWAAAIIIGLILALFLALRTPDTDRAAMIAKYAPVESGSRILPLRSSLNVHLRDTGGDSGQPVIVLIHGSNSSLHTWEPLVRLLRSDYRVVTMDMPGHGLTGAAPDGRYAPDDMVAVVDSVTRALGIERFILGGNSMGGGISWRFAIAHPERVQGLLLLNAGGMPPRGGEPAAQSNIGFRIMRSSVGRWLGERITPRALVRRSLEQSVANPAIVDDRMVDRYWELLRFPGNRAATVARFSQLRANDGMAERAREINVPTLVLFGKDDRIINPSAAHSFAERIAVSEVVLLDNIGHLPMEEAPDQTASIIRDFLDRNNLDSSRTAASE